MLGKLKASSRTRHGRNRHHRSPYAEAPFRSALEAKDLAGWSTGSLPAPSPPIRKWPTPATEVTRAQKLDAGVGGDKLPGPVRNLVTILLDGARASASGSGVFNALKRAQESVLKVRIVSARELADAEREDLVGSIARKYGRRIESTVEIDPALIGGARVHVGDEVIHASMRDALAQMALALGEEVHTRIRPPTCKSIRLKSANSSSRRSRTSRWRRRSAPKVR
jgi:F-type H+-transporting ATPase subunit delta